jgi:cytosine/uracil/thiamine/allantoin permease
MKVYREEGAYKFLSGIHPRFMLNFFNGVIFLFIYDRFVEKIQKIYD